MTIFIIYCLKDIKLSVVVPLSIIFNMSLNEGSFPNKMKVADTVPFFKGKDRSLVDNYRPISLLITISKLLEKLMHKDCTASLKVMN